MINCLGCLLKPHINLTSFCSCPPFQVQCVHINNKAYAPHFLIRRKFIILTILLILIQCILFYLNICKIFGSQIDNNIDILTFFLEKLVSVRTTIFLICGVLCFKVELIELDGIAKIVENCRSYGISSFITRKHIRTSKIYYYINLGFIAVRLWHLLIYSFLKEENSDWFNLIANCFYRFFYSCVGTTVGFQICLHTLFYTVLFRRCFKQIKFVLSQRVGPLTVSRSTNQLKTELSLKRLRRLYMALKFCHVEFNNCIGVFMAPWILLSAIALVVDTYTIVLAFIAHQRLSSFLIICSYGNILGLIVYMALNEKVMDVSEDIVSFLVKYPISKLNPAEAAQVEMLIITLKIQKPVVRASDIFTVGTRLLASICGTVITYVLVALQFHASGAKK